MSIEKLKNKYSKEIESTKAILDRQKKKTYFYVVSKLLSAVALLPILYLVYKNDADRTILMIILISLIVCYMALSFWDSKHMTFIQHLKDRIRICENEIKYLNGDYSPFRNGNDYVNSEHEFSYDLDIFGESSFFHRINRTITGIGEKSLAEKFISLPDTSAEISENSDSISELKDMYEWRMTFLSQEFIDYKPLRSINVKLSSFIVFVSKVLVGVTMTALVMGILQIIPLGIFFLLAIAQFFISMVYLKSVSKVGLQSDKIQKTFDGYSNILKKMQMQEFESDKINGIKRILFSGEKSSLKSFRELSRLLNLIDQRGTAVMYLLLNSLFMIDIYLVDRFNKWNNSYSSHFDSWMNCIGEMDALVSLATYSFNTPGAVKAQLMESNSSYVMEAEEIFHPFLVLKSPVANSFQLERRGVAIITGANMAGKSTFLRTLGVNYILANIGVPVCAKSFRFTIMSLFSSMRTSDSLAKDVSYFNAELLRIKKLLLHVQKSKYTFIILDEILKGTNSKDKLQGSVMFLKALEQYNISCVIATHDLELAKLEEASSDGMYKNYCFEIELSENIKYSYKITRGIAKNMNATYLLSNILSDTL